MRIATIASNALELTRGKVTAIKADDSCSIDNTIHTRLNDYQKLCLWAGFGGKSHGIPLLLFRDSVAFTSQGRFRFLCHHATHPREHARSYGSSHEIQTSKCKNVSGKGEEWLLYDLGSDLRK